MKKPLIFVTNDDGINAPGLRFLIDVMRDFGNIVVVAPDKSQSGMSHALTVGNFLRLEEISAEKDYREFKCSGTPVDCLKLATHHVLKKKPDLVVSGINHGSNASINVIYSGTMAAAIEGAILGIPAIGFSLLDYSFKADFSHTEKSIRAIVQKVFEKGLPSGTCLNVNFPNHEGKKLKGIKICRQAHSYWNDEYLERKDPYGHSYYWLTGNFVNDDMTNDTDQWAIENHYASLVPVHIDFTNYQSIDTLKNWKFNV